MNTNRVKNIAIVLLSAMILTISALILMEDNPYILTDDQKENAMIVLARNDTTVDAEIPRDFSPRQGLHLEPIIHDLRTIAANFFGDLEYVEEITPSGIDFFYEDYEILNKSITHSNRDGSIIFANSDGLLLGVDRENFIKNSAGAEALAYAFMEDILGITDMPRHSTFLTWGGNYVITFFDIYRGYTLHSNQLRVRVTDLGIVSAFFSRMEVVDGFVGYARPIFSPDEALLSLLNFIRTDYGIHSEIEISNMQLVYTAGQGGRGIPAYFFTVNKGGGWAYHYVINAYTNTILPASTVPISAPHL